MIGCLGEASLPNHLHLRPVIWHPGRQILDLLQRALGDRHAPRFEKRTEISTDGPAETDHPLITLVLISFRSFSTRQVAVFREHFRIGFPTKAHAQLMIHRQSEEWIAFPALPFLRCFAVEVLGEAFRDFVGLHGAVTLTR